MQTQTVNMSVQTTNFAGMNGNAILSRKGAVVGVEVCLGSMTAKEIRQAGRDLGLKGDKLTGYVNKALTNESASRAAKGAVAVSALGSAGYMFDVAVARKGSATVRFIKPAELKSPKAKAIKAIEAMSDEERAEIMAILIGKA